MPMFMMISGFVFYRQGTVWDKEHILSFFKKKTPILLIGPLIFYIVYVHTMIDSSIFWGLFTEHNKYGYWFTFVLFGYFVVYIVTRLCVGEKWLDVVLVLMGICTYPFSYPPLKDAIPISNMILDFFSFHYWHFFIFFVLGILVRKHFDKVQNWLDGKWLITISVLVFFLWNAMRDLIPLPKAVSGIPLELSGLVLLFSFFRNKQKVFSDKRAVGRVFQYVGRRTLDIYLIHFFFLPYNITFITVFRDHSMPMIEFFLSTVMSIVIICASIIIGNILRLSPFIAHWFFGEKHRGLWPEKIL